MKLFLAEDVKALKNMWLIGDVFLKDMYHSLRALKSFDSNNRANEMYIHSQYNIIPSYGDFNSKGNTLAILLNALIEAINTSTHLPRLLVLLPDKRVIKLAEGADLDGNLVPILEKFISWLVTQCNRAVQFKKEELRGKHEGAIEQLNPKLIWVAITEVPNATNNMSKSLLETTISSFKGNYILHPFGREIEYNLFDRGMSLNHEGRIAFWRYFNSAIQKFDEHKVSLKPFKATEAKRDDYEDRDCTSQPLGNTRFILPHPPKQCKNRFHNQ